MDRIPDFGLPNLVLEMLNQQAKQNGRQLDFNINKSGDIVKLTLSWGPVAIKAFALEAIRCRLYIMCILYIKCTL